MLESAPNALDKGQAQYLTPPALAVDVASGLPKHRPVIVDLNCGYGNLLQGARNHTTTHLLGSDIDPCRKTAVLPDGVQSISRIVADLTLLYPLLVEVDWRADLFVLNPPWDLHWHKDRLTALKQSHTPALARLLSKVDPRVGPDLIDSTIASLAIALDRCTYRGEGLLIANHSTIERLIFARNAPYAMLAEHIWARRIIEGNPMTGRSTGRETGPDGSRAFAVECLYFAATTNGWANNRITAATTRSLRPGPAINEPLQSHTPSPSLWRAVAEEWKDRTAAKPPAFNISLGHDGKIRTHLSTFRQHSGKLDRDLVGRLFELNGQRPMQLVQQRATRQDLLSQLKLWNVQPELNAAVAAALTEYNAIRAPLYPLPEIQRLGYLEEEDTIKCKSDLSVGERSKPAFLAGQSYPIRTETIPIERMALRSNLSGQEEEILLTGKELVFYIGEREHEAAFLLNPDRSHIDCPKLPLTSLAAHFVIPEVPDVASTNPVKYQTHLDQLTELEAAFQELENVRLTKKQREDLSRATIHDGAVLAWEPGLGKTIAGFLFCLLKVGYTIKK